ncbi:MAG: PAS domain S-box protein [Desulfobacteraceae bacterium]
MQTKPHVAMDDELNHILVVDDQPKIRQMIHDMLVRRGYAVSTADCYDLAESLLTEHDFGVVITDICFDGDEKDGISLLERAQQLQPDTPVILITGVPSVQTASQAVKLNAYEYLSKPVSLYKLAESIAAAISYRTAKDEKRRHESQDKKYRKDLEELVELRTANLVQSNQRYQLLFENSKDAIYMAASDGSILAINQTALELFGYSENELIHLKCKDLYTDLGQFRRFKEEIEEKGFVKDFESRLQRKNNSRIDCLVTAHVLRDTFGACLGIQGIIRDITDKKRAEQKIRLQNEFLVNVIESLAHPFIVVDVADFRIKIANSAAAGLNFKQGLTCHQLNHGYDQPCSMDEHRCVVREVAASRRPVTLEHFHLDKKNGEIEHEVHAFPLFDAEGEVVQVIQYCIDITEKKRLEAIAEAANLMDNLGYIFSGIRHEIGNPINSVKMALSVLSMNMDTYPRLKIREFVDRSQAEILRVEYLLKALRNFSMFESPQVEPVAMARFMEDFLSLVETDFTDKGVRIQLSLEDEAILALTDHRAFHQVMLNLMTNAADACEKSDTPRIVIDIRRMPPDLIQVQVSDNGCGMSTSERENLFRPFYTSKAHGTGLGLVIIKKMLAKMNSTIRIESSQGWGTTVTMSLPAGRSNDD